MYKELFNRLRLGNIDVHAAARSVPEGEAWLRTYRESTDLAEHLQNEMSKLKYCDKADLYAIYKVLSEMSLTTFKSHNGICGWLPPTHAGYTVGLLILEWPEASGSEHFPVPHEIGYIDAYYGLPKWSGGYGDTRRRLVSFLLRQIEPHLQSIATRTWQGD